MSDISDVDSEESEWPDGWATVSSVVKAGFMGVGLTERQGMWVGYFVEDWKKFVFGYKEAKYYVYVDDFLEGERDHGSGAELEAFSSDLRRGAVGGMVGFHDYCRVSGRTAGLKTFYERDELSMSQKKLARVRSTEWTAFKGMSYGCWTIGALELLGQLKIRSVTGSALEDAEAVLSAGFGRDDDVSFEDFLRLRHRHWRRRKLRELFGVFASLSVESERVARDEVAAGKWTIEGLRRILRRTNLTGEERRRTSATDLLKAAGWGSKTSYRKRFPFLRCTGANPGDPLGVKCCDLSVRVIRDVGVRACQEEYVSEYRGEEVRACREEDVSGYQGEEMRVS
jgi:hypothetical protein